jgi:type III pantothenate kinase
MNLLVDLGNSRLKWAWQTRGQLSMHVHDARGRQPRDVLEEAWGKEPAPGRLLVASVAGEAWCAALEEYARARWNLAPEFARSQPEQLGVCSAYRNPEGLGVDRWVALIGARATAPGAVCVVDCGTAVTVDALSAAGEHLGGAIFPGLHLLRESLARGTHAIGFAIGDASSVLAHATADGVAAGTLFGLAGAIERLIAAQEQRAGPVRVLLTGGDAARLAPLLSHPVEQVPDLVLRGLARIAGAGES